MRLNLIDVSISSYFSINNYPKRLHIIKQANELVDVIGYIESAHIGGKDDSINRVMDSEYYRNSKSGQNYIREYD